MADVSPDIVSELAPTGALRVAINFGNSVLAQKDPATGEPRGRLVGAGRANSPSGSAWRSPSSPSTPPAR